MRDRSVAGLDILAAAFSKAQRFTSGQSQWLAQNICGNESIDRDTLSGSQQTSPLDNEGRAGRKLMNSSLAICDTRATRSSGR